MLINRHYLILRNQNDIILIKKNKYQIYFIMIQICKHKEN